jgi:hypothetical protein
MQLQGTTGLLAHVARCQLNGGARCIYALQVDAFELVEEDEDEEPQERQAARGAADAPMPADAAEAAAQGPAPAAPPLLAATTPVHAQLQGARNSGLLAETPMSRALAQPSLSYGCTNNRSAATGGRSGLAASADTEGTSGAERSAALLAGTPDSSSTPEAATLDDTPSDLTSDTPSSSAAGTPAGWLPAWVSRPSAVAPAEGRRSSLAHGLLRRQTLVPGPAMRPEALAAHGAASGTAADQLRARQRLSSFSLLPRTSLGVGAAAGRLSAAVDLQQAVAAAAATAVGGLGARRSGSLAMAAAAGGRSSSLAGGGARPSSGRDSVAGAAAGPARWSARDSLGVGAPATAAAARRSAAAAAHAAHAVMGGASPGRGGLPGVVLEEEEAEAAAVEEEATEQLSKLLQQHLQLAGVGDADAAHKSIDVEAGSEAEAAAGEVAGEGVPAEQAEGEEAVGNALEQLLAVCGQGGDVAAIPSVEELLGGLLDLKRVSLGPGS